MGMKLKDMQQQEDIWVKQELERRRSFGLCKLCEQPVLEGQDAVENNRSEWFHSDCIEEDKKCNELISMRCDDANIQDRR